MIKKGDGKVKVERKQDGYTALFTSARFNFMQIRDAHIKRFGKAMFKIRTKRACERWTRAWG